MDISYRDIWVRAGFIIADIRARYQRTFYIETYELELVLHIRAEMKTQRHNWLEIKLSSQYDCKKVIEACSFRNYALIKLC